MAIIKRKFFSLNENNKNLLQKDFEFINSLDFDNLKNTVNISELYNTYKRINRDIKLYIKYSENPQLFFNNILKIQNFLKNLGSNLVGENATFITLDDLKDFNEISNDSYGILSPHQLTNNQENNKKSALLKSFLDKLNFKYIIGIGEWDDNNNTHEQTFIIKKPDKINNEKFLEILKKIGNIMNQDAIIFYNGSEVQLHYLKTDNIEIIGNNINFTDDFYTGFEFVKESGNNTLNEIGDGSAKKYQYNEIPKFSYKAYSFVSDSGLNYVVNIYEDNFLEKNGIFVEFGIISDKFNDYEVVVNKGELYNIISTIIQIIKDHIKKYDNIDYISYSISDGEIKNNLSTHQRNELYKSMIKNNIPNAEIKKDGDKIYVFFNEQNNSDEIKLNNLNEAKGDKYGVFMLYFDIENWKDITDKIDKDDIYDDGSNTFGIEKLPHCTILYGLHSNVKFEDIKNIDFDFTKPIKIEIDSIDVFNNEDFDVVKFNVLLNDELKDIREKIIKLDHTTSYKIFKPHVTISYVKKGMGKKYVEDLKDNIELIGNKWIFRDTNNKKNEINIKNKNNKKVIIESKTENDLKNESFVKEILNRKGSNIYFVGGLVRDEFISQQNTSSLESKDIDILITGYEINELTNILKKYGDTNLVGESFGVIKFKPFGWDEDIDVAVPRTESATGDGGHKSFDVKFGKDITVEDDLFRRDITINSIAKDIFGNIVDPYGGVDDIKNKIIRVVNPEAFLDDPLRMLRCVQFAARFNFSIEPKTMMMIKNNASNINKITKDRILIEFEKIAKKGNSVIGTKLLIQTNLYYNIFNKTPNIVFNERWNNIKTISEYFYMLTKDNFTNPEILIKESFDGSNDQFKLIKLLKFSDNELSQSKQKNRMIVHIMYNTYPSSLDLNILQPEIKFAINELKTIYPMTLKQLSVNGNDVKSWGYKNEEIGIVLKEIISKIYNDEIKNNKNDIEKFYNKSK